MEKPKEMAKKKKNEEEQKLESIMKVIEDISASDDSYDEDKWYPEYKDCICCKGFVFGCRNKACIDLGSCYCKMRDEIEKSMFFQRMYVIYRLRIYRSKIKNLFIYFILLLFSHSLLK